MTTAAPVEALGPLCGAHCGTDSRGTAHCPRCHAGDCDAASPAAVTAAAQSGDAAHAARARRPRNRRTPTSD